MSAPLPGGRRDVADANGAAMTPAPAPRWLVTALGALLVMMTSGLVLVWWWGHRPGPPPPVLGELPEFTLVAHTGKPVTRDSLSGQPAIFDLIFTQCQIACPRMTDRVAALGVQLPAGVRRVSVSVDPTNDTPAVLTEYARRHHALQRDWWFLTGSEAEVRHLAIDGLKLGVATTPPDDPRAAQEAITHSTKLVLVDGQGRVRGYYDAFDDGAIGHLVRDAEALASGGAADRAQPKP